MASDDDFSSRSYPIREDMRLQRYQWKIERLGWCGLCLLLVAALLGLFGTGLLSSVKVVSPGNDLHIEYGRFERNGASTQVIIRARGGADGQAEVGIEGGFFEQFSVENIYPQPASVQSYAAGQRMSFQSEPGQLAVIYLSVRPNRPGLSRTTVRRGSETFFNITQLIYP